MTFMSKTDVSLAHLKVLAAIADSGGFTAAAEKLGISQSGVSQAIAALEQQLGLPVLKRDRNGVLPTSLGERVLPHARAALRAVEAIHQEAAQAAGIQCGKIRVGSFASVAARILPGAMRRYAQRHPNVELVLLEGEEHEVRDWLMQGAIDVAAVVLPMPGFEAVTVAQDEMVVVVHRNHPLAGRTDLSPAELLSEPFIFDAGCNSGRVSAIFERIGAEPKRTYSVSDLVTILRMVEERLGLTILPELAVLPRFSGVGIARFKKPLLREVAVATAADHCGPAITAFVAEVQAFAAASLPEFAPRPKAAALRKARA
jgi:DNA-binding transcriptional LysR family regulator